MSKPLACYYAIIRFCPYPATDEFINVGVALSCPELGFFDFRRARRQLSRVNHFFSELEPRVFDDAMDNFQATLESLKKETPATGNANPQMPAPDVATRHRDAFLALTRPRETILHFSEPRVIMSAEPSATLDSLYDDYVSGPASRHAAPPQKQDNHAMAFAHAS